MDPLLFLVYIITFIVSVFLIICGLTISIKNFTNSGYRLVKAKIKKTCEIGKDENCKCSIDIPNKLKKYKKQKCVNLEFTDYKSNNSVTIIENVLVDYKYKENDFIKILIPLCCEPKSNNIKIYSVKNTINGIIIFFVGILFIYLLNKFYNIN